MNETGAMLAMPVGWILDDPGRERLRRQLARAGSGCAAVAAEWSELPPGSSHRVLAERLAVRPESELQPVDEPRIRGAAEVRAGVGVEVGDDAIEIAGGRLFVDPGTTVHDPWRDVGPLVDASPLGRPLADRPVALFVGLERDPYLADWVRALVNRLIGRDVEARIAVARPTEGLHLTRPCAPTASSIDALAPSVVVALDDPALDLTVACLGRRRVGLVRLTPDTTSEVTVERVRTRWWRNRVEATIGRGVDPSSMADLVRDLVPASTA